MKPMLLPLEPAAKHITVVQATPSHSSRSLLTLKLRGPL